MQVVDANILKQYIFQKGFITESAKLKREQEAASSTLQVCLLLGSAKCALLAMLCSAYLIMFKYQVTHWQTKSPLACCYVTSICAVTIQQFAKRIEDKRAWQAYKQNWLTRVTFCVCWKYLPMLDVNDKILAAKCSLHLRSQPPLCLAEQVTGAVGWRKDNLRYKKNEVFLDIVEQV